MAEDSRIEDKKRYNAPFLRAFDYLAGEKMMNQKQLVKLMGGESSYISGFRAGTKKVGADYMARLAAAFVEHFKGEYHLNMDYLLGKSQYMLVENVPDSEILEKIDRGANPDYDVMKQRASSEIPPQSEPQSFEKSILIERVIQAGIDSAMAFAKQTIASLEQQIKTKDEQLAEKDERLAERNKYIKQLEQHIEILEAMQHIDAENPMRSPFPVGVAEPKEQKDSLRV